MPKNVHFLEKKAVLCNRRSVGGFAPETPLAEDSHTPRVITPTYWYRFVEVRF